MRTCNQMRHRLSQSAKVLLIILSAAFALALIVFILHGFSPGSRRIPSPDGKRCVVTTINHDRSNLYTYLSVRFDIIVGDGTKEYSVQTFASDRMSWTIRWLDNNSILLQSVDSGDVVWRRGPDGFWHGEGDLKKWEELPLSFARTPSAGRGHEERPTNDAASGCGEEE